MPRNESPSTTGLFAMLEKAASVGTVIKTLAGFLVSLVAVSAAVYQHFAKESDLQALKCSVVDQSNINNQVVRTAQEVRAALTVLKQNLDMRRDDAATGKAVSDELSKSISNIQAALERIEDARIKIQNDSIKGERKC